MPGEIRGVTGQRWFGPCWFAVGISARIHETAESEERWRMSPGF